jgi:uncharacterized membrane protein
MLKLIFISTLIYFNFFFGISFSYMGPGMGGGIFAATIGIIVAILIGIFAIIWYPIKQIFKKKKNQEDKKENVENKNQK